MKVKTGFIDELTRFVTASVFLSPGDGRACAATSSETKRGRRVPTLASLRATAVVREAHKRGEHLGVRI